MSLAAPQPTPSLSQRLGQIIGALCEVLAARMAKDRTHVTLLFLAWTRLRRLAVRFEALVGNLRAGWVPAERAERCADELPRLAGLPPPQLPREPGWLLRLVQESAAYAGQVQYLLVIRR